MHMLAYIVAYVNKCACGNSHNHRNDSIILAIARASTPDDSVKLVQDAALGRRLGQELDGTSHRFSMSQVEVHGFTDIVQYKPKCVRHGYDEKYPFRYSFPADEHENKNGPAYNADEDHEGMIHDLCSQILRGLSLGVRLSLFGAGFHVNFLVSGCLSDIDLQRIAEVQ